MNTVVRTLLISVAFLGAASVAEQVQPAAGQAQGGRAGTVHVKDFGYDKANATPAFYAAFATGAKTFIVDNVGTDWIVEPIRLPSDVELVFQDGVVMRALKGAYKDPKDSMLDMLEQKNIAIRGIGKVTLVMNKADYQDPALYKPGEWRHTVRIMDCDGVSVDNLTLLSSGGDGVYVGSRTCQNVRLTNLDCIDHHRQGISVTGCKNLYVKNCKFNKTRGAAPQCGIDFEPNYYDGSGLENIVMEDCEFSENALAGVCLHNRRPFAPTITLRNCLLRDNKIGGVLISHSTDGSNDAQGYVVFDHCRFEAHKSAAIAVGEHCGKGVKLVFNDCFIDNRQSNRTPVSITSSSEKDLYGIEIRNLTVLDDKPDTQPLQFLSQYANALIAPVVENVVSRDSSGHERVFDCQAFIKASAPDPVAKSFHLLAPVRNELVPLRDKGVLQGQGIRFRKKGQYFVYAKAGQKIPIAFTHTAVYKNTKEPVTMVLSTPTVSQVANLTVPAGTTLNYELDARETGVYLFDFDAGNQTLRVACDAPGQAFTASDVQTIYGCRGRLYFYVPAGVKELVLEANSVFAEESDVSLLDADGKVVDSVKKLVGGRHMKAVRANADVDEVWSVSFRADKLFLRLGAPLTMLFSTAPENLLVYPHPAKKN